MKLLSTCRLRKVCAQSLYLANETWAEFAISNGISNGEWLCTDWVTRHMEIEKAAQCTTRLDVYHMFVHSRCTLQTKQGLSSQYRMEYQMENGCAPITGACHMEVEKAV